jgi:HAD superfamily hydrolase (TIGR01484 family)
VSPLSKIPRTQLTRVRAVFTDIDDTVTTHGQLTAHVLGAMEALRDEGVKVVPVTGRAAGWCHGLPRLWPIAGVVAENGSAAYWLEGIIQRALYRIGDAIEREEKQMQLLAIQRTLLAKHTAFAAAQDQFMRVSDIAFDHAENVAPVPTAQIDALVSDLKAHSLTTAVSSIHVHGTFGEANKLTMTRTFVQTAWGTPLESLYDTSVFIGDSLNDAPMFESFPFSVGVANVLNVLPQLPKAPAYITHAAQGDGFIELADAILSAKSAP